MVGYEMLAQAQRDLTPEQVKPQSILALHISSHLISSSGLNSHDPEEPHKNLGVARNSVALQLYPW